MTKGKPSFGKRNKTVHVRCKRCGSASFHIRQKVCSKCGYGKTSSIKDYKWQTKRMSGKRRR